MAGLLRRCGWIGMAGVSLLLTVPGFKEMMTAKEAEAHGYFARRHPAAFAVAEEA